MMFPCNVCTFPIEPDEWEDAHFDAAGEPMHEQCCPCWEEDRRSDGITFPMSSPFPTNLAVVTD